MTIPQAPRPRQNGHLPKKLKLRQSYINCKLKHCRCFAAEDAKNAIDGGYHVFYAYLNLAAAAAFMGKMDEAKAAVAEARRLNPNLSIKWLMQHKPVLQFAYDELRRAGLPEE